MQDAELATLRREAAILARYLTGREVPDRATTRYVQAIAARLGAEPAREPISVRAFASPWTLPFLDAGAARLAPEGDLRQRLIVMAAILEADTSYCDLFIPQVVSRPRLLLTVALALGVGCLKALIGIPLFLALRGPVGA